ncbi:MAG: hypothetical protein DRN49_05335 [Thaumarchaeota archaeon]|nr:MAG: hypothetical protein DRN49_05335 [Nitrososphaerota archaeon]
MIRRRYFFILSGVYETLPRAELKAVLEILDPNYRLIEENSRIVVAETLEKVAKEVIHRTAYTKLVGEFVLKCETDENAIIESIKCIDPRDLVGSEIESIAVRGIRLNGAELRKLELEALIGKHLLNIVPRLKVDLERPDLTVIFVSQPKLTVIGKLLEVKPKHFFDERIAGRRPFSLPSTMQPDFSRAMVNLARTPIGGRILDPFAGAGGIMIEALLLGYEVYGIELKDWIALGGLKNLKRYAHGREFMIVGDARKPMFRERFFDAIVTDPPYGRSTTIPDKSIKDLLIEFFEVAVELLVDHGRIVLAIPSELDLFELIAGTKLKVREIHLARVHRSLTRKVVVLES